MLIKTPVRFVEGATIDLEDADGQTILSLDTHCNPNPETRQAIIDAFEGAAQPSWGECERISDLPDVDEALRGFAEDQTGDNATCIVRAVIAALRK